MLLFSTGCAIHYYDPDTGTEHLWGVGHMRMKAKPSEDGVVRAVVTGSETLGFTLSAGETHRGIGLGYDNRQAARIHDDASVTMEFPTNSLRWRPDLFEARIGSAPPWITNLNERISIEQLMKGIQNEDN